MIGEHQDPCVLMIAAFYLTFDTAEQGIQFLVPGFDNILSISPEHVLDTIERIKHNGKNTFIECLDLSQEYFLASI